jgi:hypothetical protein
MAFDELLDNLRARGQGSAYLSPDNPAGNPLLFEAGFWILVLLVAAPLAAFRPRWIGQLERKWVRIARFKNRCVVGIFAAAILFRLALLRWIPVPTPWIHDEFSYLLQGKMFVSGHIAQPTPVMWQFFEGYHINMVPTYQSMYPPVAGLFLALGYVLGSPWIGVLLSCALMCAVVTWALQAWVPPHWALAGGAYCVLRYALFSYWMNSYFGGAAAALAGALLLGVAGRIVKRPSTILGLGAAFAILLLANTRPYEGLLYSIPLTLWILYRLLRNSEWKHSLTHVLAPALVVLAIGFASMLFYNQRSTGRATVMPYTVNFEQYHIVKPFFWQKRLPIPAYHHQEMRRMYITWELPSSLRVDYSEGRAFLWRERIWAYYMAYFWPFAALFIPSLWLCVRHSKSRMIALLLGAVFGALMLVVWHPLAHYAAPCMAITLIFNIKGLRWLRCTLRKNHMGLHLSRAAMIVMFGFLLFQTAYEMMDPSHFWFTVQPQLRLQYDRARLLTVLHKRGGKHLVIVHAGGSYIDNHSWIYNEPDIEHAEILFARDMGHDLNARLIKAYPGRQVSYIDYEQPFLRPYFGVDDTTGIIHKDAALAMFTHAPTAQALAFPELLLNVNSASPVVTPLTPTLNAKKSR